MRIKSQVVVFAAVSCGILLARTGSAAQSLASPRTHRPSALRDQVATRQPAQAAVKPATLPPAVSPGIVWVQCSSDAAALGATCATLPVPLDRQHPNGPAIGIYFELYLHTNPGPAESAILFNTGGPGVTATQSIIRTTALALFGQNLDVHDLLLTDDRGRGLSNTITCDELQHGTAPFWVAESDCAAQLGSTASR